MPDLAVGLVVTVGDSLSIIASVSIEMSEISLRLAGAVGACGLGLAAGSPGVLAAVDQHAAEVRDVLAGGERSSLADVADVADVADLGPVNWADEAHDALGAGR